MQIFRTLRAYWPYPVLGILMLWMLLTRLQGYQNLIVNGQPMFGGVDAWYQFRTTMYTVQHWPSTLPYEVWSGYPTGALKGQFGTLFDQFVATVAIVLNGGDPTGTDVRYVLFFIPPVLGALTALPVYYLARVITEQRVTAVLAVLLLSLFTGQFYTRTTVGYGEHNAAEPLLMAVAVAAVVWVMKREQQDSSVEAIVENQSRYRRLYRRALVAAVALTIYLGTWPPGIVLVGIFGLLVAVYGVIIAPYTGKNAADFLIPVGSILVITGLLMMLFVETVRVTVVAYGPLQVLLPLVVGATALILPVMERRREKHGYSWYTMPTFFFVIGFFVGGVGLLVAPDAVGEVLDNVGEVFGLGFFAGARATIAEAQPLWSLGGIYSFYGIVMFVAILTIPDVLIRSTVEEDWPRLIIGFWALMLLVMAISQIRFNYYFALAVAIFGAFTIERTVEVFDLASTDLREYDKEQLFIAVSILATVSLSLVGPVAAGTVYGVEVDGNTIAEQWRGITTWAEENTPQEGQLENPNGEVLPYYGTYKEVDDYNYPEGTYGVVTPWEAGHFVTVFSERIPVANPFQQHVSETSQFLYSTTENESAETLTQQLNAERPERYVLLNWELGFVGTPTADSHLAYHPNRTPESFSRVVVSEPRGQFGRGNATRLYNQSFYRTTAFRLMQYHGSRIPESSIIVRWERVDGRLTPPEQEPFVERVGSPEEADRIASNAEQTASGGIGVYAREPVPALEHYRMVRESKRAAGESDLYNQFIQQQTNITGLDESDFYRQQQYAKLFERVPGATIRGTAEPNTTVNATVTMETANGNRFQYTQHATADAQGRFTMTVPYSTTGYDNWGPANGYTNVSTRAVTNYRMTAGNCSETVTVPEGAVIGEETQPISVDVCEKT